MSEKINEFIHHSRMKQEILFQLLSHNKIFHSIPVGQLQAFSRHAITQIGNYQVHVRRQKPKRLYTDADFNSFREIFKTIYKDL